MLVSPENMFCAGDPVMASTAFEEGTRALLSATILLFISSSLAVRIDAGVGWSKAIVCKLSTGRGFSSWARAWPPNTEDMDGREIASAGRGNKIAPEARIRQKKSRDILNRGFIKQDCYRKDSILALFYKGRIIGDQIILHSSPP